MDVYASTETKAATAGGVSMSRRLTNRVFNRANPVTTVPAC